MKRVRVGILLDRYRVPAWAHLMLARIVQSQHTEIVLVVLNETPRTRPSFAHRLRTRWKQIPSRLVGRVLKAAELRLMERVHCEHDAFAPTDLEPLLQDVPVVRVRPIQKRYSDYLDDADIATIAGYKLDVLVRLGFRVLRGAILTVARHGVWSYHHGDYRVNRGGPAGFWEAMESWPETGTVLQRLTEDLDGGVILYQSWSLTSDRSITLNNNARYWTSASFLPRVLDRLATVGDERFLEDVERRNVAPVFYSRRLYTRPGNAKLASLLARKLAEKLARRLSRKLYFEQWCLLYAMHEDIATSLRRFRRIVPAKDRFWADPNVTWEDGTWYIFIEEFPYASRKGHISLLTMDRDGRYSGPVTVIEERHHLSYPFVFTHGGAMYMLAEAGEARAVPLYRCVDFPLKWEFEKNLLEGIYAVDPTLLYHGGRWYLFLGVAENPGASPSQELFLYSADDPVSGTWVPHPLNPVVSDVRSARPAGRILERKGELFRPSQDCSQRYGRGVALNRIVAISDTDYREERVGSIEPSWSDDVRGVHTLSHAHQLTVMDANLRRSRFR